MNEEADKIEDMRKRGRISAGQAEKLRKTLPGLAKPEKQALRSDWPKWISAVVAAVITMVITMGALLTWNQKQIQASTQRIESNLEALRKQGFLAPTHFPQVMHADTSGELVFEKEGRRLGLPLKQTDVQVDIHTDVARVFVTQLYVNNTTQVLEALYVFPLPQNSAVDSMIMTVGAKRIRGIVQKRQEARDTYERAKTEGKTAALLEQERPDIFTQNIANILPGDSIRITISFLQEVKFIAPNYYYYFPTVVGPRYTAHTPDAAAITPPVTPPVVNPADEKFASAQPKLTLALRLNAGVPIRNLESASHKLNITSLAEKQIDLQLVSADNYLNKDFLLKYRLAGEKIAPALQAEDGHFKLTLLPQFNPTPEKIFNRELIFVMDVSGSMSGQPIEKCKEAMNRLLRNLRRGDRFRLVTFASGTEQFSETALEATPENIHKALDFVSTQRGYGGTEMLSAVRTVLAYPHGNDLRRIILFLTDGYIGNETQIVKVIGEQLGDSRVFSLGIGSSVNHSLIEGIGVAGRGVARVLRQDGSAKEAMQDFYRDLDTPVLSNVSLRWEGVEVEDVLPRNLPDLFQGNPLTVLGKYHGAGHGTLTVEGLFPGGGKYHETIPVDFSELKPSALAVKSLWARRKVDDLELLRSGIFGNTSPSSDNAAGQIESIGLQYRIMTAYTSFVAVLDQIRNDKGEWTTVEQPVSLPEGMDSSNATAHATRGGSQLLASSASSSSLSSYDMLRQKFTLGSHHVAKTVSGLARQGGTRVAGRKGNVPGGWNEGYAVGGSGGVDDLLGGLWGGDLGPDGVKAKGAMSLGMRPPTVSDLVRDSANILRESESIVRIIRQHMPGLRHTFNKYLKNHPGMKGLITFKFTIIADGTVSDALIVSSTTGTPEFDEEVRAKIQTWKFEPIKSTGKDVITIPFNFSV